MKSNHDSGSSVARVSLRVVGCAVLALAAISTSGCGQETEDEPRGGGYVEPKPENQPDDGLPKPEARSALGKAKERAERFVNEDVAEYNKKIEDAADGKYP